MSARDMRSLGFLDRLRPSYAGVRTPIRYSEVRRDEMGGRCVGCTGASSERLYVVIGRAAFSVCASCWCGWRKT